MSPEPNDAITFPQITQTDTTGIVTSLHDIPYGDVWPCPAIMQRKREIEAAGFMWDVVESLPIHNPEELAGFRMHVMGAQSKCRSSKR
jgi:mannonate dehydratase